MPTYQVPVRTTDWQVQSVYTIRDRNGKPVSCILSLTRPGFNYMKKVTLMFDQLQKILGCIVDVDDPSATVRSQWLRISETVVAIDDNEAVI